MIAHVAEAGEARGRVVLRVVSGRPSEPAIKAALTVAKAFNASVESLYVEDNDLIELARYPFAREVSFTGRSSRQLRMEDMERDLQYAFQAVRRHVEALARLAEVPVVCRSVRDAAVRAVASACAECGPWNVVALAEPISPDSADVLAEILDTVADLTGVVMVGARAGQSRGPVVLALEDAAHLSSMLHAADRLAAIGDSAIVVVPLAADEAVAEHVEALARLYLADRSDVRIVRPHIGAGETAAVVEAIRRLGASFLLAQFGGLTVPRDRSIAVLGMALECPLLVVR